MFEQNTLKIYSIYERKSPVHRQDFARNSGPFLDRVPHLLTWEVGC